MDDDLRNALHQGCAEGEALLRVAVEDEFEEEKAEASRWRLDFKGLVAVVSDGEIAGKGEAVVGDKVSHCLDRMVESGALLADGMDTIGHDMEDALEISQGYEGSFEPSLKFFGLIAVVGSFHSFEGETDGPKVGGGLFAGDLEKQYPLEVGLFLKCLQSVCHERGDLSKGACLFRAGVLLGEEEASAEVVEPMFHLFLDDFALGEPRVVVKKLDL